MIRLLTLTTFAASLLLWSVHVSGQVPGYSGEALVSANGSCYESCCSPQCHPGLQCSCHIKGLQSCPIHGSCPLHGHNFGLGHRLGVHARSGSAPPPMMTVPMPVEPPPHGFLEGLLMPQQYQQVQPIMPPQYQQGQPMMPPQYQQVGYGSQDIVSQQRIVYVPYAAPPPIYVERLGKALPGPPILRRILGDANMYEYPEMPLRTYTTRGPRDFLAPNPPGIGY